ncbi:MAG: hypothetical protein KKI09_12255 [Spirochaetes bacterium]|nr:hypothetical protein [Spirochaetota bacterium]MBU0956193.1 hypothetical protein [Spirochaetota bacterium]
MCYRIRNKVFVIFLLAMLLPSCTGEAKRSPYALAGNWYCEAADTGMAANSTLSLKADGSYSWVWQLGTERGQYDANLEISRLSLQAEYVNTDTMNTTLQLRFAFQGEDMLILIRDDGQSWVFVRQAD